MKEERSRLKRQRRSKRAREASAQYSWNLFERVYAMSRRPESLSLLLSAPERRETGRTSLFFSQSSISCARALSLFGPLYLVIHLSSIRIYVSLSRAMTLPRYVSIRVMYPARCIAADKKVARGFPLCSGSWPTR